MPPFLRRALTRSTAAPGSPARGPRGRAARRSTTSPLGTGGLRKRAGQIAHPSASSTYRSLSVTSVLTNSPRTRAPEGSAWTDPASSLLGTTALRPPSRTSPRRSPKRCYAPSWPCLRPGHCATRLGGAGDRVLRQPVHQPQPQVLPGTNPSLHVEPPLSPECMKDRAYRGCAGGRLMAVPNGNIRPDERRCCFEILVVPKGPRTHARTSWPTSRCRWSGNACTRANRSRSWACAA